MVINPSRVNCIRLLDGNILADSKTLVQVDIGVEETGDQEKLGVLNSTKEVAVQVDMEVRERADQEVKVVVGMEEVAEGVELGEDEDTL